MCELALFTLGVFVGMPAMQQKMFFSTMGRLENQAVNLPCPTCRPRPLSKGRRLKQGHTEAAVAAVAAALCVKRWRSGTRMQRKKEEFKRCGILLKVTNPIRPSWPRFLILSCGHVCRPACVTGGPHAPYLAVLAVAAVRPLAVARLERCAGRMRPADYGWADTETNLECGVSFSLTSDSHLGLVGLFLHDVQDHVTCSRAALRR